MPDVYDAIVLGVGGFGSSAMFHLALRGLNVLGIDRFSIAHDRGSSHGETRIIRKAYFEHSDYVPLLLRAYDLWAELEATSLRQLFWPCGLMLAGLPESEAIAGARLSARTHGLNIENLSPDAAQKRWPGFRIPETFDVVFEPEAGFLGVEECVRAHVELAASHGANLLLDEPVVGWSSDGSEVRVRTANRELVAKSLVITAGAWASSVLSDLEVPLQILRKPLFWYETTASDYTLTSEMPTFYFEMPNGLGCRAGAFYGFPSLDGRSLKTAEHTGGDIVNDPLCVNREVQESDWWPTTEFLRTCLPSAGPSVVRSSVCLYTITPDRHFIVDRHPHFPNVVLACGFSGHGFKFTSVIGEVLADLAVIGRTPQPIEFLRLERFSTKHS